MQNILIDFEYFRFLGLLTQSLNPSILSPSILPCLQSTRSGLVCLLIRLGETAAREAFTCFLIQSFIGWSAQDASLLVDAKIAVQRRLDTRAKLSVAARPIRNYAYGSPPSIICIRGVRTSPPLSRRTHTRER
jgi:hypothetical protein